MGPSTGKHRAAWCVIEVLLFVVFATGCSTKLGWVPGYIRQDDYRQTPRLADVRKTAADLRDGWDTRATTNRYAGYVGAAIAAAAAGALTGLAAFDSGNSAIVGIPIGTGFLAAIAAGYNNEAKAQVYSRASRYVTALMTLSDQRLALRALAASNASAYAELLHAQQAQARKRLDDATKDQRKRMTAASLATGVAAKADDDPGTQEHLYSLALVAHNMVLEANQAVNSARSANQSINRRLAAHAKARATPPVATGNEDSPAEAEEARCLTNDLNALMALVDELNEATDPKNLAKLLSAVGSNNKSSDTGPGAGTSSGNAPATATPSVAEAGKEKTDEKKAIATLADLELSAVKSTCADSI